MQLNEIYSPIKKELIEVEQLLKSCLQGSKSKPVLKICDYLLSAGGKRLRPALVLLSAKATKNYKPRRQNYELTKIASAMELIHTASLIHDDIIDRSDLRHHKPTINSKFGEDVSIALGDYLYSIAFELISTVGNCDIMQCISCATKAMCEGELIQVCERDNIDLLKQRYIIIVKKKTANLFAASCEAGAIAVQSQSRIQQALKDFGLNFGIAFQIIDDCLDLIGQRKDLGKAPGADFKMGELTLPILNLISLSHNKEKIFKLLRKENNPKAFKELRQRFIDSKAVLKTRQDICCRINKAKSSLNGLGSSSFKQSLLGLADFIEEKTKA